MDASSITAILLPIGLGLACFLFLLWLIADVNWRAQDRMRELDRRAEERDRETRKELLEELNEVREENRAIRKALRAAVDKQGEKLKK